MDAIVFFKANSLNHVQNIVDNHKNAYMPDSFHYWSEKHDDYYLCSKSYSVDVFELKRVLDSHECISESYGNSLESAHDHLYRMQKMLKQNPVFPNLHNKIEKLKQVIADVEACQ